MSEVSYVKPSLFDQFLAEKARADKAEAEVEALRGLLRRGFAFSANCEADPEQPEAFRRKAAEWASEVQAALAGAADQPNSTCERGEARSPVCPLPESGCDDSGSATVQPSSASGEGET